jgi:hypothetical protein
MKVGDWIVVRGNYKPELRQIVKLTPRMVDAIDDPHGWKRPWRAPLTAILYAGTERRARWLLERLVSSDALYTEEHKAALRRKTQRQEKLVAEAAAEEVIS